MNHPDRPHRLKLQIRGGEPSALGVALVESSPGGAASSPPRLLLDACASGPPILQDGPPATFEWVVFPRSLEIVLVMVNRSPEAEVRAGAITLTEMDETGTPSSGPRPSQRGLGLYLTGSDALDRFGGSLRLDRSPTNRRESREVPGLLRCDGGGPARRIDGARVRAEVSPGKPTKTRPARIDSK